MGTGKDTWNEIETVYSKLDYEGLASLFATDAVHVDAVGRHEGREAIGAYMEEADKPFSDISMETPRLIEEGDTLVAEWLWRATYTETGKAVEVPGVSLITVRDGMIMSQRDYFDNAAVMSQLGLMPGT